MFDWHLIRTVNCDLTYLKRKQDARMIDWKLYILSLCILVIVTIIPGAFADHLIVEVEPMQGAAAFTQECAEKPEGCWTILEVTINEGEEVKWINTDFDRHTVTNGVDGVDPNAGMLFTSGVLKTGDSFSYTFDTAGEYPYFCALHPWMTGLVIVQADELTTTKVPEWVRNIFVWYGEKKISEDELIGALQFLIKEGIIKI